MVRTWLHRLFDFGIVLKGLDGLLEVTGGILLLLLSPQQLGWLVYAVTRSELAEDPRDLFANFLLHVGTTVTPHDVSVSVLFLLSHGLVKIFLVWELFRGRLWAYPLTIAVLLGFVFYQTAEIVRHHSPLLTLLTILDLCIAALAWHEYRMKRSPISTLPASA